MKLIPILIVFIDLYKSQQTDNHDKIDEKQGNIK